MSIQPSQSQQDAMITELMSPGMKAQMAAALPRLGITPDRMARIVLTCMRKTPKLFQCERNSVLAGIIELAQLGLEPSTPLGHAWLIPFGRQCQVVIGYKGFITLADRAGISIGSEVVYERDEFEWPCPGDTRIKHRPYDGDGERGGRVCAYAYAIRDKRAIQFKVVSRRDIERAMQSSSAVKGGKKDSPWFGDENGKPEDVDAMWRKTAIRRLAPFLPLSSELARALELDEQADAGVSQMFSADAITNDAIDDAHAEDLRKRMDSERGAVGAHVDTTA